MKRITHSDYVSWVNHNRPEYVVEGQYVNTNTKIEHKHIHTGLSWMCSPDKFKQGVGHPSVTRRNPAVITTNEYKQWVADNRSDFIVLGEYVNTVTKIMHQHIPSNTLWECAPGKFKLGHNPPSFSNNVRITNDSYDKFLQSNHIGLIRLDDVTRKVTSIAHQNTQNGEIIYVSPKNILQNKHYDFAKIRNSDTYTSWLLSNRPEYELIGHYVTSHTKTVHRHIPTDTLWNVKPNNVQQGQSSPHISGNGYSTRSLMWLEFIKSNENIDIQHAENGGEFIILGIGKVDGYSKLYNTVFEYHGDFWHGNPLLYDADDVNPVNYQTYGSLFNATMERDQRIVDAGFNLVIMWDSQLDDLLQG